MNLETAALEIIQHLRHHHHTAYFVGGYVRDQLLQIPSSDIDIVTSATTSELIALFPKTIPVGLSFGIVVVVHHGFSFEVATFRKDSRYQDGRHPESIQTATPQEDAQRRDFTMNGIFYDPLENKWYDYVGGRKDLENRLLKAIGNPIQRFTEDHLRMIRAARYAAIYHLHIDPATQEAIQQMAPYVCQGVSIERIYQELEKMHHRQSLGKGLEYLFTLKLLYPLFPSLENLPSQEIHLRIQRIKNIPRQAPLSFGFILLFQIRTPLEFEKLMKSLKAPNSELKSGLQLLKFLNAHHPLEIAEAFASPLSKALIETRAILEKDPALFIKDMREAELKLQPVIERLLSKTPILHATVFMDLGVPAGPRLKQLMEESMRLYAENPTLSPEEILGELKGGF